MAIARAERGRQHTLPDRWRDGADAGKIRQEVEDEASARWFATMARMVSTSVGVRARRRLPLRR